MPTIPCSTKVTCPTCDVSPLLGLSSEAPDVPNYLGVRYSFIRPPLNQAFAQLFCVASATGPDQATADVIAQRDADQCVLTAGGSQGGGNIPQPNVFFNAAQSCTVLCPDGLPFTFTIAAGLFIATSQTQADAQAFNYACKQAQLRAVCLSALSATTGQQGLVFSGTINATGGALAGPGQVNNWAIVGGSLPPGLTFSGGFTANAFATITGTPTAAGTFPFTVECTDPQGDTMTKQYSITITACAIEQQITFNDGTWVTGAGASPYDSAVRSTVLANGQQHITMQFASPTAQTWAWALSATQPDSFPVNYPATLTVKINGVVQNGIVETIGNPVTWNGNSSQAGNQPIQTASCGQAIVVDILVVPNVNNQKPLNILFEWQTP